MSIKSTLHQSIATVQAFLSRKFKSHQKLAQIFLFYIKMGSKCKVCFCDSQKAHSCAKRRHLTYLSYKLVQGSWL